MTLTRNAASARSAVLGVRRRADKVSAGERGRAVSAPARPGRACERRAADDGSSSVELVLVTPAMMLVLMVIVQFAVYFCALHVTQAAAAQAAAGVGSEHGRADDGTSEAHRILGTVGNGFVVGPNVAVTRTARVTTVRISGTVVSVVPFLHLKVASVVHTPNEVLTTATAS